MISRRRAFSSRVIRLALWAGGAALALGVFLEVTDELMESSTLHAVDEVVLRLVARRRVGWLNAAAVDVTALGSPTLVTLHCFVTLAILLMRRDRLGAAQLVTASGGAGLLTLLTKEFIERARPSIVPALVDVSGYSYPSGHSSAAAAMYLTIGLLVCRHLPTLRGRLLVLSLVGLIIGLVAGSRVYLGVHYPTDIASGVSVGVAWALFSTAGFSLFDKAPASTQ